MDYAIKRGDTLTKLAKQHGTTVDAIMDANKGKITDRNRIYAGDTIVIPDTARAAQDNAARVQPDAPAPAPAPQRDARGGAGALGAPRPAAPAAPAPARGAAAPAPAGGEDEAFEQRVLELVNVERAKHGLAPVRHDDRVDRAAEGHNAHQASVGKLAHDGIGDGTLRDRLQGAGWKRGGGENIAMGQVTPEEVMQGWMDSPGHRANILNPDFRVLGVAYGMGGDRRPYWTQVFGAE